MAAYGGGALVSTRETLIEYLKTSYTGENPETNLALRILRGEPIKPEDISGPNKIKIIKCASQDEFSVLSGSFSAAQLAALAGNKVALVCLKEENPRFLNTKLGKLGNTPAHFAALAHDKELMEDLQGDKPLSNVVKSTPHDVFKLVTKIEDAPYSSLQITSKQVLQLWMASIGDRPTRGVEAIPEKFSAERIRDLVEVKRIEGLGEGLFAKRDIPKQQLLMLYGGTFSSESLRYTLEEDKIPAYDAVFGAPSAPMRHPEYLLEGIDGTKGTAGKINDGYPNTALCKVKIPGLPFSASGIVSLSDIRAGEQLLVDYGLKHTIRHIGHVVTPYEQVKRDFLNPRVWDLRIIHYAFFTPSVLIKLIQDKDVPTDTLLRSIRLLPEVVKMNEDSMNREMFQALSERTYYIEQILCAIEFATIMNEDPAEHGMRSFIGQFISNGLNAIFSTGHIADYRVRAAVPGAFISALIKLLNTAMMSAVKRKGAASMLDIMLDLDGKYIDLQHEEREDGRGVVTSGLSHFPVPLEVPGCIGCVSFVDIFRTVY